MRLHHFLLNFSVRAGKYFTLATLQKASLKDAAECKFRAEGTTSLDRRHPCVWHHTTTQEDRRVPANNSMCSDPWWKQVPSLPHHSTFTHLPWVKSSFHKFPQGQVESLMKITRDEGAKHFPFLTQPHTCRLCCSQTTPATEGHQQSCERVQGWVTVSRSVSRGEALAEVNVCPWRA